MKHVKTLLLTLTLLGMILSATAYEGIGSGNDVTKCNNNQHDDEDGMIDGLDPGCVQPYYADNTEASVWDTDLTNVLTTEYEGSPLDLQHDPSVFYKGRTKVKQTVLNNGGSTQDSLDPFTENYITNIDGKDGNWGGGDNESETYTNFPTGTVLKNKRAIDPPNNGQRISGTNTIIGEPITCGDGEQTNNEEDYVTGETAKDTSTAGSTNCRADYGRIYESYHVRNNNEIPNDPDCGSGCPQSPYTGTLTGFTTDGDTILRHDKYCSQFGSCVLSCPKKGPCSTAPTYSNEHDISRYDCNQHNVVDGGGDTGGGESDHYDDEYPNKPDNDPAATLTDFTAHNGNDQVWCGFESTKTVDADGPNGNGDGFVVINEGNIVARESPDESHMVGKKVMVSKNGEEPTRHTAELPSLSGFSASCPGEKTTCLKYVDMWTKEGTSSPGSNAPVWYDYEQAIKIDVRTFKPTESMSVCKAINRIYQDQTGKTDRLIECSVDRDDDGNTGSSTILEPGDNGCGRVWGDEPGEYPIYKEGPEVDDSKFSENTGHFQSCVDTETPVDPLNDRDACVLKGKTVPEGTVKDINPNDRRYEKGEKSADYEVCLDIEEYNDNEEVDSMAGDNIGDNKDNTDNGGEWYDLDSSLAQKAINSGDITTSDIPGYDSDTSDEHRIGYYWRENPDRQHPKYNPQGGNTGIALEDDCGNSDFIGRNGPLQADTLWGCDDQEAVLGTSTTDGSDARTGTFYGFFGKIRQGEDAQPYDRRRDDDYNPEGDTSKAQTALEGYRGFHNKMQDLSDQFEPEMDTSTFNMMESGGWPPEAENGWKSSLGNEQVDRWAYTPSPEWVISSTGLPFPPYGTYTWGGGEGSDRSDYDSDSVMKASKVHGNSWAAVAKSKIDGTEDDNGNQIKTNDGVWIDPDRMRELEMENRVKLTHDDNSWWQSLRFGIDLTGPDSGLGYDIGTQNPSGSKFRGESNSLVRTDIYWEGELDNENNDNDGMTDEGEDGNVMGDAQNDGRNWRGARSPEFPDYNVGETVTQLEPPMCGDDRKEFLVEEMGESHLPARFDGQYACTNTRTNCVDFSASDSKLFERGSYQQTDEWDENIGRLKNDREYCAQSVDGQSVWYDQDYGDLDGDGAQETCDTNSLYGSIGVRWFDADYIKDHPTSVRGGIDDDWNQLIQDQGANMFSGLTNGNTGLETNVSGDWNFNTQSPVPSGSREVSATSNNQTIATLGFCGGDDEGEYLVTQQCANNLCETRRDVIGVARNPESCILDESTMDYDTSIPNDELRNRQLFAPGDEVSVDLGQESVSMTCFNGFWHRDYPLNIMENTLQVPSGEKSTASFQVINVRDEPTEFDVSLVENFDGVSAFQFTRFANSDSQSFQTTIPARSSKQFSIEVTGGSTDIDGDLEEDMDNVEIEAEGVNTNFYGRDNITVTVSDTGSRDGPRQGEPENVPGITAVQLAIITMISSVFFFLQS
ncbi:MAG: hypothetical protein H8Z69_00960 [Nanohaloarchaea archaeon]|nr:hypothetical protein [Candidatus Nanohaloarchaea archaeon]